MILELLIGLVIVCITLYLIWKKLDSQFSFKKFLKDGKSVVLVKTNKPLKRIALIDQAEGEKLTFVRNNIEKGDLIEFVYAPSQEEALLIIDDDSGTHTFKLSINQDRS